MSATGEPTARQTVRRDSRATRGALVCKTTPIESLVDGAPLARLSLFSRRDAYVVAGAMLEAAGRTITELAQSDGISVPTHRAVRCGRKAAGSAPAAAFAEAARGRPATHAPLRQAHATPGCRARATLSTGGRSHGV